MGNETPGDPPGSGEEELSPPEDDPGVDACICCISSIFLFRLKEQNKMKKNESYFAQIPFITHGGKCLMDKIIVFSRTSLILYYTNNILIL